MGRPWLEEEKAQREGEEITAAQEAMKDCVELRLYTTTTLQHY